MKNSSIKLSRFISKDEKHQVLKELDVFGYTSVSQFLKPKVIDNLLELVNNKYENLNGKQKINYPGTPDRNVKDKILYSVHNIHNIYIDILTQPFLRYILMNKLNDPYYRFLPQDKPNYILGYYNARSSGDKLELHIDSNMPFLGSKTYMMQVVFLLQDSTLNNGCTIVVPGSHKSGHYSDRDLKNVTPLTGKAGDILIWDSRLWHGTLENYTGQSRWGLVATFSQWWVKPSVDIVRGMNDNIYRQCTNEQKQMLGFCSIPPIDEFKRNNTKCGYDFLLPSVKDYNFI